VYQSSKQARDGLFEQWSEDDALKLLAANMIQDPSAVMQIVGQRFFAKGDRRVGFYTLLMASGRTWDPQGDHVMADGSHVRFDPVADHADSPLARYVFLHQQQMTKSGKIEELDLATGPGGDFVEQLAAFRDLHVRWTGGKATGSDDAEKKKERERALEFVRASKSPLFGWAVLTMVQNHGGDTEFYRALAEAFRTFERTPGLAYAARYEAAYCVLQSGDWQKAMELFRELHAQALKQGIVPPVEQSFRQAFQIGGNGPAQWSALWRDAAEKVISQGDRTSALALAWQCHKLGDSAMADELFATTMRGVADDDRPAMTLAAIGYLSQTEQFARADALLQPMLEDEKLNQLAWLWRLGARLAEKHGMTARSVACLDRAMDIEYSRLPDEVDLESARAAFGSLLEQYQKLADSIASLQSEPPMDIVRRVIRVADRWRSLDPDDTAACQAAGRVLQRLGVRDAAWEYVTTPLADRPGEAPQWSSLAGTLRGQNEFDLADRAYRSAFDAEPTNAQILWDHAQMLEQRGQTDKARQFYRKIAESSWGPEFQSVQEQARKFVTTP
jgi:tetratricopeptide (TPR) repeat protein